LEKVTEVMNLECDFDSEILEGKQSSFFKKIIFEKEWGDSDWLQYIKGKYPLYYQGIFSTN
jgi:hypothetical protein